MRGEASDDDQAIRLAADNGNAEGDVGFTASATCLAGIGRIVEQGVDAELAEGAQARAVRWGVRGLGYLVCLPVAAVDNADPGGLEEESVGFGDRAR